MERIRGRRFRWSAVSCFYKIDDNNSPKVLKDNSSICVAARSSSKMYSYPIDELRLLRTRSDVWNWCVSELAFLGMAFGASVFVVVVAAGVFRMLMHILRAVCAVLRFVWKCCIAVRILYMGVFYPNVLLGEIACSIKEPVNSCSELKTALDKVLSEHHAKTKELVADLTSATSEDDIREQVKLAMHRYHMSRAFRDVVLSHVTAVRDNKSADERHFQNQEKTREETAWHRLYIESRASFHKVSKKMTGEERENEKTRISGFEFGFVEGEVVRESDWTIEQKIHVAKRFVVDVFGSDTLPVETADIVIDDDDEEHSTEITHVNTVVLCGRIYVETIDNWNNRLHYDPSDYSSLMNYGDNRKTGDMGDTAWATLHEKDRAERRALLAEDAQYAQELADAVEADRIIARDTAILMNVRTHRSGKTYVQ
jgi:hypothetical protein